ncbi:AAA family ATPase [Flavobacterium sp. j3]|uniref:AAA family ATPase n=1 Tax=Flavobacterium aureirubrum TaxID=3133147 RepID=A0ABU9N3X2_9FLAO
MITEIKLKGITSYKNEVIIPELKKLNFFFGSNGSGKSTIAKYLYNLSLNEDNRLLNISNCNQNGYNPIENEILVYDENFIKRNFIDKDSLNGIFSLNEKNAIIDDIIEKEQDLIDKYKLYLKDKLTIERAKILKDISDREKKLKEDCFKKRNQYNESFSKLSLKHSGNSANHLSEIRKLRKDNKEKNHSFNDLQNSYNLLYEKELKKINSNIDIILYRKVRKLEFKINNILQEVIIGNNDVDIADLINTLGIKKWVEEGTGYINLTLEKQKCPFCQNDTIDKEIIEKFNDYFDINYKNKINEIENLKNEYSDLISLLNENFNAIKNETNSTTINELIADFKDFIYDNEKTFRVKLEKSNEKKSLRSILEFKTNLKKIINDIKLNNSVFENIVTNKSKLDNEIWERLAFQSKSIIDDSDLEISKLNNRIKACDRLKIYINDKIANSEKIIDENKENTVNTNIAKDNINTILRSSGLSGFEIAPKTTENNITQYYLKRENYNDSVFKTLSEGEKNFISFLYFYQLCILTDDENKKDKKKIIVIDDPVSSLDSQVLFLVTTLIRELAKKKGKSPNHNEFALPNIEQVYVLSHNIYFFKEVTFVQGSNNKLCNDLNYFQITKINQQSSVIKLHKNNINSDYNLLWKGLYTLKSSSNNDMNIVISNLMRRIIQSYLNFTRLDNIEWNIINDLPPEEPKRIIFSALISQINDDSHHTSPFEEMHYQKISNTTPELLFEVFEMIFDEIGKEHKEAIIKYVTA